jgi:hypothetical protein
MNETENNQNTLSLLDTPPLDHFAGLALQGILAARITDQPETAAQFAYEMAAAMIIKRKKITAEIINRIGAHADATPPPPPPPPIQHGHDGVRFRRG